MERSRVMGVVMVASAMMESVEGCVERLIDGKGCCLRENNDNCGDERKCFFVLSVKGVRTTSSVNLLTEFLDGMTASILERTLLAQSWHLPNLTAGTDGKQQRKTMEVGFTKKGI